MENAGGGGGAGYRAPNSGDRLPGLSYCHRCNLSDDLQFLESQWRLVLLCPPCLSLILSAAACSYCFSIISDGDRFLPCRRCPRRIHLHCAPLQRGYISLSDINPENFSCIDCCPYIRPHRGKPPTAADAVLSLENLAKDASAAAEKKTAVASQAKEKAARKAAAASRASDRARSMLGVVATGKSVVPGPDRPLPDEELALQLHLAMNGSRRILRNCRGSSSKHHPLSSKRGRCSNDIYTKVEFCTEDKGFFDSVENLVEGGQESCDRTKFDATEMVDQEKGIDGGGESNLVEEPVKDIQESGSRSSCIVDSGETMDWEKGIDGCSGSNLVDVPLMDNKGSGSSSSSIMDYDEKMDHNMVVGGYIERTMVQKKVIDGRNDNNLVDVLVRCNLSSSNGSDSNDIKDQNVMDGYSDNHLVGGIPVEGFDGYSESNLVEIPVMDSRSSINWISSMVGSHDMMDQKKRANGHSRVTVVDCNENKERKEVINWASNNNLVEVPVKEQQMRCNRSCSTFLDPTDTNYQKRVDGYNNINLVGIHVEEEQERCSNGIDPIFVSCQRVDQLNDILVQSEFKVDDLKDSLELQQKKNCGSPDRYMKKYSKRHSGVREMTDGKESQLVPYRHMSCSELSKAAPDTTYQTSTVSMHSSPHTSLPGCE